MKTNRRLTLYNTIDDGTLVSFTRYETIKQITSIRTLWKL